MVLDWRGILAIGALLGVAAYVSKREISAAASAINPVNPNNVFSQGANAITQAVTGNSTDTLGTAIYNLFHNDPGV